ncbi:MAG: dTDP-glucose 4,6-dehydratase [Treponema sp.]|jgi:dTDP-glucose 4,6-dehydratase|nr:dTDP-glucose 4,6-dehydratase [Treponema sp.]
MRSCKNLLVSGGAGFIGVNFIRLLLSPGHAFSGRIINLDALTYAGNLMSLEDIAARHAGRRYFFELGDIGNFEQLLSIFTCYEIDTVVHFAAESHVDRSIAGPEAFIRTNVLGTFRLLEAARQYWGSKQEGVLFHHISTDEVYGSLGETGYFTEKSPYDPRSPYSASKASSDHLVMAYHHTYGLPVTLSNCSNNYGPYQFPEKLIPLMILRMLSGKALPVYGDGKNIRDWLYVEDHASALWAIITGGRTGEKYNIGGENEWDNISLLHSLIALVSGKTGIDAAAIEATITFVKDRPGHDRRYAIDCSKLKGELPWKQSVDFETGLAKTVDWYLAHPQWIAQIQREKYQQWLKKNYDAR